MWGQQAHFNPIEDIIRASLRTSLTTPLTTINPGRCRHVKLSLLNNKSNPGDTHKNACSAFTLNQKQDHEIFCRIMKNHEIPKKNMPKWAARSVAGTKPGPPDRENIASALCFGNFSENSFFQFFQFFRFFRFFRFFAAAHPLQTIN